MVPRTTVNIDQSVLIELKRLQKETGKSLGELISELVAEAVASRQEPSPERPFRWLSKGMGSPRVPLEDKERLYRVLDS